MMVHAQEEPKISGVVFEKGSKIRIALAEVRNKRNNHVVGTNDMGLFTVRAHIGDTLWFSKRGFNEVWMVVGNAGDLIVHMGRGETLNEVVIYGEKKVDVLNSMRKEYRNKGSYHAGKPPFLSFLFTPLTALYELVGRTPKNARRFERYYQSEIEQSHIDQFFNPSLIRKHTPITESQLSAFMMHYRPTYDQSKDWNTYDALKWIKDSYKKYSDTATTTTPF